MKLILMIQTNLVNLWYNSWCVGVGNTLLLTSVSYVVIWWWIFWRKRWFWSALLAGTEPQKQRPWANVKLFPWQVIVSSLFKTGPAYQIILKSVTKACSIILFYFIISRFNYTRFYFGFGTQFLCNIAIAHWSHTFAEQCCMCILLLDLFQSGACNFWNVTMLRII